MKIPMNAVKPRLMMVLRLGKVYPSPMVTSIWRRWAIGKTQEQTVADATISDIFPSMTKRVRLLYIASLFLLAQPIVMQAQTVTFVQPPSKSQSKTRPLAKGIADIQALINKEQEQANDLQDAISEHVMNIGEILYGSYAQEGDPAKKLIELKNAYEGVHSAVQNGTTGQVWPAIGQFGQALLDDWSELNSTVNGINAFQQIGWEAARLRTTQSELDGYNGQINTYKAILQSLESKSEEITARRGSVNTEPTPQSPLLPTADPILPVTPPGDFSALEDSILIDRWLDLGNRAFRDKAEEDGFYSRFPMFQKFRSVAETRSPRADVERAAALGNPPASNTATRPHSDDWLIQLCAQTSDPPGNIFWSAAGCDKIGSPNKNK